MFSVFRSFQKWRAFHGFNFVKRLKVRMRSVGGCSLSHPERVNGEDRMNLGQIISHAREEGASVPIGNFVSLCMM
jgi:hypothetical protein